MFDKKEQKINTYFSKVTKDNIGQLRIVAYNYTTYILKYF